MQLVVTLDHQSEETLQEQLLDQIRGMILDCRLKAGDPLPATRVLGEQAGVSRNTVILAYERLAAEGYIESRRSVGTFVSSLLPEDCLSLGASTEEKARARARGVAARKSSFQGRAQTVVNPHSRALAYDFWVGRPDPSSFPVKSWRRGILRRLSAAGSSMTEYGCPTGLLELREAIADHLGPARGITVDPDQVVVVGGSQEGLNLVARILVTKGTTAVVEDPCYQGALFLLESYGADLHSIAVDAQGLQVSELPKLRNGLAYVTPSHQYPMGVTLPLERRMKLLDWAAETGSYIIEDDYDSDFRYSGLPLPALKGLDSCDSVVYLGTFSKSLGAGLRIGFLVVPRELVEPAKTIKTLLNNGQPWLEQAVLADFLNDGSFKRHLRRNLRTYKVRRDCLIAALTRHFGPVEIGGKDSGMHIVWRLADDLPAAREIQDLALSVGVGLYSLNAGAASETAGGRYAADTIMLGYSSLSEKEIEAGISRVAEVLKRHSGVHSVAATRRPAAHSPSQKAVLRTFIDRCSQTRVSVEHD